MPLSVSSPSLHLGKGECSLVHTLAQPDQRVAGTPEKLRKRARSKWFTTPILWELIKQRSPFESKYRKSLYCTRKVEQVDGRLRTHYCGNRWCLVCNRIRTARLINTYKPIIESWRRPHFVTVTIKNCKGSELASVMDEMQSAFTSIKRSIRRTHLLPFVCLRKLECTHNASESTFHPHFHLVVEGGLQAGMFIAKWANRFGNRAHCKGQDLRDCTPGTLTEVFKYFTHLLSKNVKGKGAQVHAEALDTIFRAMRGRRVFQPVGFVIPRGVVDEEGELELDEGTLAFKRLDESVMWTWVQYAHDWIDLDTGECLTEYEPSERFRSLVESIGRSPPGVTF